MTKLITLEGDSNTLFINGTVDSVLGSFVPDEDSFLSGDDYVTGSFYPETIRIASEDLNGESFEDIKAELLGDELGFWGSIARSFRGFRLPSGGLKLKMPRINIKTPNLSKMKLNMKGFNIKMPNLKLKAGGGKMSKIFDQYQQLQDLQAQQQAMQMPEMPSYDDQSASESVKEQTIEQSSDYNEEPMTDIVPNTLESEFIPLAEQPEGEEIYGELIPRRVYASVFDELNGDSDMAFEIDGDDLSSIHSMYQDFRLAGYDAPVAGPNGGIIISAPSHYRNGIYRTIVELPEELNGPFDFLNPTSAQAKRKKQLMMQNVLAIATGNQDLIKLQALRNLQNTQRNKKERKQAAQIRNVAAGAGIAAATVFTGGAAAILPGIPALTSAIPTSATLTALLPGLANGAGVDMMVKALGGKLDVNGIAKTIGMAGLEKFGNLLGPEGLASITGILGQGGLGQLLPMLGPDAAKLQTPEGVQELMNTAIDNNIKPNADGSPNDAMLAQLASQLQPQLSELPDVPSEQVEIVTSPTGKPTIKFGPGVKPPIPLKDPNAAVTVKTDSSGTIILLIAGTALYFLTKKKVK